MDAWIACEYIPTKTLVNGVNYFRVLPRPFADWAFLVIETGLGAGKAATESTTQAAMMLARCTGLQTGLYGF